MGSTVCLPCGGGCTHTHDTLGTELVSWWSTDRGGAAGRRRGAGAAAARRAARAGAWSSRAAGRAGPARAWRGRGRRSWVAPSLRCERPPTERVRETLPCERRFFPTVFFAGAGRGGRPMAAGPPPPPRPPPPATLIYVPYIKRVFRVPLWIFLGVVCKAAGRRCSPSAPECRSALRLHAPQKLAAAVHSFRRRLQFLSCLSLAFSRFPDLNEPTGEPPSERRVLAGARGPGAAARSLLVCSYGASR